MASFRNKVDRFYEDSDISKNIEEAQCEIELAKTKGTSFLRELSLLNSFHIVLCFNQINFYSLMEIVKY